MVTTETLTSFFGWMTVINIGIYALTCIGLTAMRGLAVAINTRVFRIDDAEFARVSFRYIAAYKLVITVFCFVPWVALNFLV